MRFLFGYVSDERSAAVDKIEEKRKPEDFIGHRKPGRYAESYFEYVRHKDDIPKYRRRRWRMKREHRKPGQVPARVVMINSNLWVNIFAS